ncbi:hypothetical protein M407DRAFT_28760 [Tulasnella calospora MUT 4182]|uniref:F-box domain-containing protein n=1 Tax=Tulasnella calospora MUT 4182 TaxID=1051891 RepID=A0A0C3QBG0_9AGAM|nr:hypothetical protein M407DRAFT_28760 [Tulasnella calospora MUT 4182]
MNFHGFVRESKAQTWESSSSAVAICNAIRAAAASLTSLTRRRWNSERPINQLPDELLFLIFEMVLDDFPFDNQRRMRSSSYLTIQQILRRVCSRWSDIITSSRGFWATLCCLDVPRKRFHLALSKSKESGLRAICRCSRYCSQFVAEVLALSDRWESIDVLAEPWILHMSRELPNLRRFRVTGGDRTEYPANFRYIFPNLVELHLEGIAIRSIEPPLNLRALVLHGKERTLDIEVLVHWISSSKQLESMEIVGYLLWIPPNLPCPSASALKLRRITIGTTGPYDRLALLLNHLELSPDVSFALTLDRETDKIAVLSEYASRRIAMAEGNPPLCVDFRQTARACLELRTSEFKIPFKMSIRRRSWLNAWADYQRILRGLQSVVEGGRMLELHLPSNASLAGGVMRMTSACLPQLTTLGLWGPIGLDLLAKRGPDDHLLFPQLSRLRIHGAVDDDTLVWLGAIRKAETQVEAIQSVFLDELPEAGRVRRLKHVFPSVEVA